MGEYMGDSSSMDAYTFNKTFISNTSEFLEIYIDYSKHFNSNTSINKFNLHSNINYGQNINLSSSTRYFNSSSIRSNDFSNVDSNFNNFSDYSDNTNSDS